MTDLQPHVCGARDVDDLLDRCRGAFGAVARVRREETTRRGRLARQR